MGIWDFLSVEPSQELVKPVPPSESARRRLVEIVDTETKKVLASTETRGSRIVLGAFAGAPVLADYLNLDGNFDPPRLARVSRVHGVVSFLPDGTVIYEDNSRYGTVIERRQSGAFAGLPVLRFQVTNVGGVNDISGYLTRSAVTNEAEVYNIHAHISPHGLLLRNGDTILPGFNYDIVTQSGIVAAATGAAGKNTLRPPAAITGPDGKPNVPRLAVYIR
ncbi:hypothetical protein HYU40_03925 [Candidatus Woesearchaeota archaeon]|nr:hypothetical protein [Candidatus Woesearchaeota archaeon]